MGGFVKVGKAEEFREGCGRAVVVEGKRVAVFRSAGSLFALQDRCPHMAASLADGRVEGGRVTCFMHGWVFDLASGNGHPPAKRWACARVYEVKLEGDDVWIGVKS